MRGCRPQGDLLFLAQGVRPPEAARHCGGGALPLRLPDRGNTLVLAESGENDLHCLPGGEKLLFPGGHIFQGDFTLGNFILAQ